VLNTSQIVKFLLPDGPLSSILKGYEPRIQQQQMLENVCAAYNTNSIALIEAGTGTGKSMAYLIPAILWAAQTRERTVISTNTINLQEQLIHKDIPLVSQLLNAEVKAVLVKGMNNYVCLRKLEDAKTECNLIPSEDTPVIQRIAAWAGATKDGSRSDLGFSPESTVWEKVNAESDVCTGKQCPFYNQCFFIKAREAAEDAQILIVNHHLLFADLALKMTGEEDAGILPPFDRVIIDEAHNIEDVATDFFADRVSNLQVMHVLGRLAAEKQGKAIGKLQFLKTILFNAYGKEMKDDAISRIIGRLSIDIPGLRRDVMQHLVDSFQAMTDYMHSKQQRVADLDEHKLRLRKDHYQDKEWQMFVIPSVQRFIDACTRYSLEIAAIDKELHDLKNEKLDELTRSVRKEILALSARLSGFCQVLSRLLTGYESPNLVRWLESQKRTKGQNTELIDASLDVSEHLVEALFNPFKTVILCSATLAADGRFDFIRTRLGLDHPNLRARSMTEHIYESPFNFQKQALLLVPTDIPKPTHLDFNQSAAYQIWNALQASRGNAFVLFTSYSMLQACYTELIEKLQQSRYHVLKQGSEQRQILLNKFKTTDRSVLFGTDSFWEGVDVVGDALRCVIIAKLPFKSPGEPIIQARSEAIAARGGDPFWEYSLPQAIVKFKQGFGRLIRNKSDRGCVVCLDSRLISQPYGRQFLNSLPPCPQIFSHGAQIQQQMTEFYRRTYPLVARKID
jgi:ATP-dependent DNA helicase DinG